tara:strand:+ start:20781 stop:22535 length:1755 start_codon:yes stop_codon:yes gene_type:complete
MKLASIKPGRIVRRRGTRRIGSGNRTLGASKFFGGKGTIGAKLRGAFRGNVKGAPGGLSQTIKNISQSLQGGGENSTVNINKVINQKVDDSLSKRGSLSAQVRMPQLDGLLNSFGSIADYMRGVADPTTVAAFAKGFEGIRESLEDTTETIGKVRKFIKGFIGDLGKIAKKGGVLPGLLGGLNLGSWGKLPRWMRRDFLNATKDKKVKTNVPNASNFMKSKKGKLLLGLGAFGALAAGGMAMAQPAAAGEVDPSQIDAPPPIPEKEVNLFNKTVKKFQDFLGGFAPPPPPKTSSPETTETTSTPTTTAMGSNVDTPGVTTNNAKAAIQTITQLEGTAKEGGYSRWFGDREGEMKYGDITGKTLQEVDDLQTKFLKDDQSLFTDMTGKTDRSAAVGAGQFTFLLDHARRMDPNVDITKQTFSEEYQNKLMMFLAKEKGVDLNKPLTEADMEKLGDIWASLTPKYNQTSRTASDSLRVYQNNLQRIQNNVTTTSPDSKVDPLGEQSNAATSSDTIEQVAQIPQTETKGEDNVNFTMLPMGDMAQLDPSNVPAPSIQGNSVPFHMPFDEDNLYRLGTMSTYNLISTT